MKKLVFLLLVFTAALTGDLKAQNWVQTNGPGGDHISSIAVNSKGDIFIASRRLDRSTDGGKTWMPLFLSAPLWSIGNITLQPSGRIIVSGSDTVFASDDNGDTWNRLPLRSGTFWQGASGMLFAPSTPSFARSIDNGDTWTPLILTGVSGAIRSISSDAAGHLFVCADFLYRSTDDGGNWSKITNGLSDIASSITNVAAAPGGQLYAICATLDGNIFRSDDSGITWTLKLPLNDNPIYAFSLDSSGNLFFIDYSGGLHYSSDKGDSWMGIDEPDVFFRGQTTICSTPGFGGAFLYAVGNKFYRWAPLSPRVTIDVANGSIASVIVHPDSTIVAFHAYDAKIGFEASGQEPGLFWYSKNQGNAWLSSKSIPSTSVPITTSSALDSSKRLIAALGGSIIVSIDSGRSWKSLAYNLTRTVITALAVRPNGDIFA
ncbi:MAG: hypothetical protein ACHQM6_01650, partial [Candidatus Kapaibacterium sp.]